MESVISKTMAARVTDLKPDSLAELLRNLFEGDGSDWNRGILRPDMDQECSEVETNPPSPDVAVYPAKGAVLIESGQNNHVITSYPLMPEQPAQTSSRTVLLNSDPDNALTLPDHRIRRSTPSNITRAADQCDTMSTQPIQEKMQPGTDVDSSIPSAPVIENEESVDIHTISVDELIPFQSYVNQNLSVEEIIATNVAVVLSAEGNHDKRMMDLGNRAQPTTQIDQYPEAAATTYPSEYVPPTSTVQQHSLSQPQPYINRSGSHSDQTVTTTSLDSLQDMDLQSLFQTGEVFLPSPTMIAISSQPGPNDVADATGSNIATDTTACLASLTTGGAYLEATTVSLDSLLGDDKKLQPEIKKAAEEAIDTKSASPFIKSELKSKIQLKRLRHGQKELRVSFENKPMNEPSEEEKEKIDRRKEMNRKSANQSRINRQNYVKGLKQEIAASEKENETLRLEITKLKQETLSLKSRLCSFTRR